MPKDPLTPASPDQLIISPTSYRIVGPDAQTPGSQEVVNNNADKVNSFIAAQRQRVELGQLSQLKAYTSTDDLDITYLHQFGQERVELKPYVTPPPPFVEQVQILLPPPDVPEIDVPVPEPVDIPAKYLMVLFGSNKVAAINMVLLAQPSTLVPEYLGEVPQSTFGPFVPTGQYTFGGISFIQTDIDLSGKALTPSILCSTLLTDAISMGRKTKPVMNSSSPMTMSGSSVTPTFTLYTSIGSYEYDVQQRNLTFDTATATQDQPSAIDTQGNYYYSPTWKGSYASLTMQDTSIDQSLKPQLDAAIANLGIWVTVYTTNSIQYKTYDRTATRQIEGGFYLDVQYADGARPGDPPREVAIAYFPGTWSQDTVTLENDLTVVAATVVPNDGPGVPPEHINQSNLTDIIGESYYGKEILGSPMTLEMIKLAYGTEPYYTFDIDDLLYETKTYEGIVNGVFSGQMPRMVYSQQNGLQFNMETVVANATETTTVTPTDIYRYPFYGGALFQGEDDDPPSIQLGGVAVVDVQGQDVTYQWWQNFPSCGNPPDGYTGNEGVIYGQVHSKQITGHSTIPLAGALPTGTYGQIEGQFQVMLSIMAESIGPNGSPILRTFSGSGQAEEIDKFIRTLVSDTSTPPFRFRVVEDAPTESNPGTPIPDPPPSGYRIETIVTLNLASIQWNDTTLAGRDDGTHSTNQSFTIMPFPPGIGERAYGVQTITQDGNDTTTVVTPFSEFPNANTIDAWLHVCNADHYIQGVLVDGQPHLYLDGTEITQQLSTMLNCLPTELSTMVMDMDLSTIQALEKVTG